MDSRLESHIDEIFKDVRKSEKLVVMINRIKSKANAKYLQICEQGYSRNVAYSEVDDWIMKAKVIVDEEEIKEAKEAAAQAAEAKKVKPASNKQAANERYLSNTPNNSETLAVQTINDMPAVVVERVSSNTQPQKQQPSWQSAEIPSHTATVDVPVQAPKDIPAPQPIQNQSWQVSDIPSYNTTPEKVEPVAKPIPKPRPAPIICNDNLQDILGKQKGVKSKKEKEAKPEKVKKEKKGKGQVEEVDEQIVEVDEVIEEAKFDASVPEFKKVAYEPVAPQPVYQPAVAPQPVYQPAVAPQPVYQKPVAPQPVYQKPVAEIPTFTAPASTFDPETKSDNSTDIDDKNVEQCDEISNKSVCTYDDESTKVSAKGKIFGIIIIVIGSITALVTIIKLFSKM
ncbi:MAG: hypothetical protein RR357_00830 [Clostridia bacterium]